MTIKHLRIFSLVCELGGVTRAAEHLHMTQPAVSRAIHEMEDYYHLKLFERDKQRLTLTEAGRIFSSRADQLVSAFDLLERDMRDFADLHELRIGANYSMSELLLPALVQRLKEQDADLKIRIRVAPYQELSNLLLHDELDIALMGTRPEDERFTCRFLGTDRFVAVLSPDHPLTAYPEVSLAQLLRYPYYCRERGSTNRSFVDAVIEAAGLSVIPEAESCSPLFLVHAASKGYGVAIMPEHVVRHDAENGTIAVRPISDASLTKDTYIVWRKDHYLNHGMQEVIDTLRTLTH